jgi:hypothetical protein
MNKDSIANAVSFAGAGAVMIDLQSVLTLILVASGIVLNVMRIMNKGKRD